MGVTGVTLGKPRERGAALPRNARKCMWTAQGAFVVKEPSCDAAHTHRCSPPAASPPCSSMPLQQVAFARHIFGTAIQDAANPRSQQNTCTTLLRWGWKRERDRVALPISCCCSPICIQKPISTQTGRTNARGAWKTTAV